MHHSLSRRLFTTIAALAFSILAAAPALAETDTAQQAESGQSLGIFSITAYCGCDSCSGGNLLTCSGTVPQANHTVSADLDLYPLGTQLMINGIVYTVEDSGSSVEGNELDIYFDSHQEALNFGRQQLEVFSVTQ